jgi:hypothetical protein
MEGCSNLSYISDDTERPQRPIAVHLIRFVDTETRQTYNAAEIVHEALDIRIAPILSVCNEWRTEGSRILIGQNSCVLDSFAFPRLMVQRRHCRAERWKNDRDGYIRSLSECKLTVYLPLTLSNGRSLFSFVRHVQIDLDQCYPEPDSPVQLPEHYSRGRSPSPAHCALLSLSRYVEFSNLNRVTFTISHGTLNFWNRCLRPYGLGAEDILREFLAPLEAYPLPAKRYTVFVWPSKNDNVMEVVAPLMRLGPSKATVSIHDAVLIAQLFESVPKRRRKEAARIRPGLDGFEALLAKLRAP